MTSDDINAEIKRLSEAAEALPHGEREAFIRESCPSELQDRVRAILARLEGPTSPGFLPVGGELERFSDDGSYLQPGHELGAYRILRRLGQGGMAVVYLAEHTQLHHQVALKVLPEHFMGSGDRVERFRSEAVIVANLKHPNIVAVHDVSFEGAVNFIVMDFIDGPTLAQHIKRTAEEGRDVSSPRFIRRLVEIIAGIADALQFAHGSGIVHRDVKPENILLGDGIARLTDFGIAKNLREPSATRTGNILGSVAYMSPEQAKALPEGVDPRSDIFSLGVVLYESLSLQQPFRAETIEESISNVINKIPRSLRQSNPGVSKDLETICHKAIEKKPIHRYQAAAQFAGDLRCYLEGRPILASPPSALRVASEWSRRHRTGLWAGVAVGLLFVVGWFAQREARRQREELCLVQLTSSAGEAELWLRTLESKSLRFGAARSLGPAPLELELEPGHHRISCATADGRLAERSFLALPGAEHEFDFEPTQLLPAWDEDMQRIPGGAGEASFLIDRREVSNAEYHGFIQATGHPMPKLWEGVFPEELARRPVVGVSFEDAQAYARWCGKRLPSAHEWERAMRAPNGARLPWGDRQVELEQVSLEQATRVDTAQRKSSYEEYKLHTRPTDSDPQLATALGLFHGATNVREFTDTTDLLSRVQVRGASWIDIPEQFDLTTLWWFPIENKEPQSGERFPSWSVKIGFRCARSLEP